MQVAFVELVVFAGRIRELGVSLQPRLCRQRRNDGVGTLLLERAADAVPREAMQRVLGEQHDLRHTIAVALLDRGDVALEQRLLLRQPESDLDLGAERHLVEHEADRTAGLIAPVDQAQLRGRHAGFRRAHRDVEQ